MTKQYGIVYEGTVVIPIHVDTNKFGQYKLSNGQYVTMCQYEHRFPHPIKNCLGFIFWLVME